VTDTEHHTREGRLYRTIMPDTDSRRVDGSPIDVSPTAALGTNALGMASYTRQPPMAHRMGYSAVS
jgi:putative transposase